jgi:hypothetical protein
MRRCINVYPAGNGDRSQMAVFVEIADAVWANVLPSTVPFPRLADLAMDCTQYQPVAIA